MFDQVIDSTDWIPLSDIPSSSTQLAEAFWADAPSTAGVYLVAHNDDIDDIGESISHKDIGYVGQTSNNKYRVYSLRTTGHNCGKYIRQQGWRLSDVSVRFLYTDEDEAVSLEKEIHNENKKQFNRRFKWSAASAGNDGKTTQIAAHIEKCNLDEVTEVYKLAKIKLSTLLMERHLEEMS